MKLVGRGAGRKGGNSTKRIRIQFALDVQLLELESALRTIHVPEDMQSAERLTSQSLDQCAPPLLERGRSGAAAQHNAGSFIKQGSHSWIASARDTSSSIGFTRLEPTRCQPKICGNGPGTPKPVWIFDRAYVRERNDPGALMRRLAIGSAVARRHSALSNTAICSCRVFKAISIGSTIVSRTGLSWIAERTIRM
jgi:hypothetical protein